MAINWGNLAGNIDWGTVANVGGGLAGAYLANQGADQPSQVSSNEPWGAVAPYLRDLYGQAGSVYEQTRDYPVYPGQTYAGYNPLQDRANQAQLNMANYYGAGMLPAASQGLFGLAGQATEQAGATPGIGTVDPADYLTRTMSGNVNMGPYNAIADQMRIQSGRNLEETLPQVDLAAIAAGQKGGSGEAITEGIVRRGAQESLDQNLASMYGNAYSQAQGLAGQAAGQAIDAYRAGEAGQSSRVGTAASLLGQLPGMAQANLGIASVPGQIGAGQQAQQQLGIDDAMMRWNYPQQQAGQALGQYSGLLSGAPGGTQTITQPSNAWGNILGGALTGGRLAGGLFGSGGQPAADQWQWNSQPSVDQLLAEQNLWG